MAKLLWAFSFEHKLRDDGSVIEMNVDPLTGYTEGFLHCAKPFECAVNIRSEKRKQTLDKEFLQAEQVFEMYTN